MSGRMTTLEEDVRDLRESHSDLVSRIAAVESNDLQVTGTALDPRLSELEMNLLNRIEAQERELRKCNVVIKGAKISSSNLVAGVSNFLLTNFAYFRGKVLEAKTLKEGMICIKLDSFDSKKELFALKKASDLSGIFFQKDRSPAEQEAGFQLREFVRAQKALGRKVTHSPSK